MSLPIGNYDLRGNVPAVDAFKVTFDTMTNAQLNGISLHPAFCCGTGAPTFSAAKGTIYTRLDGSSTSTRIYVNTDGSTTWTNVTTAA